MSDEQAWIKLVKEADPRTAAGCGCGRLFHGHYKVELEIAWRESILLVDAELLRLRQDRAEAVKIIMSVVGNGLLKEPEFTALDKRARDFYERREEKKEHIGCQCICHKYPEHFPFEEYKRLRENNILLAGQVEMLRNKIQELKTKTYDE